LFFSKSRTSLKEIENKFLKVSSKERKILIEAPKDMPPFVGSLETMAAGFYKLAWTEDGYPGRLQDDGKIWEHPIYPTYVLKNYIFQYKKHPSVELEDAIRTVAYSAIKRMQPLNEAIVFWYEPGKTRRLFKKHYSALTQSYYAIQFYRAGQILNDSKLLDASRKTFLALKISEKDGGVLFRDKNGVSIAEVPQEPNSYILNGWQSALVAAWTYYELSGDTEARDLVLESAATMEKLLSLYDSPNNSSSYYGLTGYTYVRTIEAELVDAKVSIPTEGTFELTEYKSRWANHRVSEKQVNLVFSLASFPEENVLMLKVNEETEVQIQVGSFDPLSSEPVDLNWITLGRVTTENPSVTIPWEHIFKIVYPTNFVKKIDGKNTNVYHSVHINRLHELHLITGLSEMNKWRSNWTEAISKWDEIYPGLHHGRLTSKEN
jgi:hypothetical protein